MFWIIEGHCISSYEHFASLNRLFAELSINKKKFTVFLDSIPALKNEFNILSEQFVARYNAKYTILPCKKFEDEVIVECSMDAGVEVVLGELQYYEDRNSSECPLTDTLLSIIGGCLKENKRMIVICGNDAEAKDIAERIDTEFRHILLEQELPNSRTAISVSLKLVGGVVYAANNPFYDKDDGFIPYIISKNFLIVVGSKKRLLYTGYEADVVINIIFTGSEKAMLDSEYSALFNLTIDQNSSVVTLTDSVVNAFSRFNYQPRLFNRTIINLINNGSIKNMDQLGVYASNCFINNFDFTEIVKELSKNGAVMEVNGEFEILGCKYLSGFYATEKRRLLSEALSSLNLKDILYLFFLANVYFVDASETLTLPRTCINSLFADSEVKVLCERVKLHDPRIRGNHYMKLESSIVISSILYKYFQNVSGIDIFTWVNDIDRLNVYLVINQQNFRKTFAIAQDLSSSFATIFKHLENICSQFNLSSLKQIHGLDFETVDLLISGGIKSVRDFVHSSNLETYLRSLANKREITVRQLYQDLRTEALSLQKPRKRLSLNTSGNTSRDIFSASNVGEEIVFKSLCVQNVSTLNEIFALPINDSVAHILHVRDSDYLTILRIDEKKVTVFEQVLNCCDLCEKEERMNEILKICNKSNIFVTNIFDASESFATAENPFDIILKANCLTAFAYVIGPNDISVFAKDWQKIHGNICIIAL
uniref:Uncharacterized protein n=1 Tax=Panagrolaimus superbus TaxID=310955 RepID=A0A914Y5X9_9BILA